jgi:hypothetical protein
MNGTNGTTQETTPAPTSIVRYEDASAPIEPVNFSELRALAKDAAASKFFGANSPEQALMVMMAGRDLGLSYTQALRAFHVIEGKPALSADGMVAVCLARKDVCEYFRVVEADDKHATVVAKRAGDPERRLTFTFAEAERAGLVKDKGGWAKWPGRMCLARAKSFLARELFPDLLMGMYDPDELRDSREEKPQRARVESVRHVGDNLPTPPPSSPEASQDASIAVADGIAKAVLDAKSQADLDTVAKHAMKSLREGLIVEAQFNALGERIKARRVEIGK